MKLLKHSKTIFSFCFLTIIAFYSSCKKTTPDPKPKLSDITLISKDIYSNTIQIKASVLNEGTSAVSERGFCYNTFGNPSVSDTKVSRQFGQGDFSYTIQGCSIDSIYYIKAYAVNSAGISYSSELKVEFKSTIPEIQIQKTINTQSVSVNIKVIKDGQAPLQMIGCRISKSDLSKDSLKYISEKRGNNIYFDSLEPKSKYYIMAFAKNKNGLSVLYDTLTTLVGDLATIGTPNIIRLEGTFIDINANIISNGGTNIKEQGFIVSNSPISDFSSGNQKIANISNFQARIDKLNENTIYYVKAYAINSAGINLSTQTSFTTNYYNRGDFKDGGYIYWTSGQSFKVISYIPITSAGKLNWSQASTYADTSTLLSYTDWLLPDRWELTESCNLGIIRNEFSFWSSTQSAPNYHHLYAGCITGTLRDDLTQNVAIVRQPK
jgi:hypothetical protein